MKWFNNFLQTVHVCVTAELIVVSCLYSPYGFWNLPKPHSDQCPVAHQNSKSSIHSCRKQETWSGGSLGATISSRARTPLSWRLIMQMLLKSIWPKLTYASHTTSSPKHCRIYCLNKGAYCLAINKELASLHQYGFVMLTWGVGCFVFTNDMRWGGQEGRLLEIN